jgi:cellulose biosynthesis protein BcsQ
MIITFCGQKGGTGKTTLSYLVAETLSRAGKKVAIRDDDPQASVSQIVNELRESGRSGVEILERGRAGIMISSSSTPCRAFPAASWSRRSKRPTASSCR